MIDAYKQKICDGFSKAIPYYDEVSEPQKIAAQKTFSLLLQRAGKSFPRVLELGCGTGHFTKLAAAGLDFDTYLANDLCEGYAPIINSLCPAKLQFCVSDAEYLPFEGSFDLICACSVIQWFSNLSLFLDKAAEKLETGGIIALSTFCPGNLAEIRSLTGVGLDYYGLPWYKNALERNFKVLELEEESICLYFDSPRQVLKHVRLTGAAMGNGFRFTPRSLASFEQQYLQRFSENGRCRLTYNPLYIIAQKL